MPQQVAAGRRSWHSAGRNRTRETFEKEEDALAASSTRVELDAAVGASPDARSHHGHALVEARRL